MQPGEQILRFHAAHLGELHLQLAEAGQFESVLLTAVQRVLADQLKNSVDRLQCDFLETTEKHILGTSEVRQLWTDGIATDNVSRGQRDGEVLPGKNLSVLAQLSRKHLLSVGSGADNAFGVQEYVVDRR